MKSSAKSPSKASMVGAWIFLIILVLVIIGIVKSISSDEPKKSTVETSEVDNSVAIAQKRQSIIDRFAPVYCANKQSTKVVLNDSGVKEGWPGNDGSGWNNDECVTIVSKLYDSGATEQELDLVTNGKYAIGMLEMSLLYSLGSPSDINRTRSSGYVSAQYVYGSTYIYAENGKVTSVQN